MKESVLDSMQNYLTTHYYTLEQLIKKTTVKKETILELIAANCIPPHSYTVKQNLIFSSSLLETKSEDSIVQYYPKSLVSWIKKATQLQTLHDVTAIAKIIREDFINELRQKLAPIGCNDLYLEDAWNSLLTGI